MSSMQPNPYQANYSQDMMAAWATEDARVGFIRRTYLHLAGAIALFAAIEGLIFTLVPAETRARVVGL